ncbi:putative pre-mRNA-splicing factor 38 [Iris pallida]|uniref:Pre-mRNA-splicing factor 38 n=1 Tax=Iris pallida TaxID=29817 RepID=A0AAX6EXD4_IRIPA|nr:putative pre-mRNA-splicing factor 38 [Iris pallida]
MKRSMVGVGSEKGETDHVHNRSHSRSRSRDGRGMVETDRDGIVKMDKET